MPSVLITTEPWQHRPGRHVDLLRSAGFDVAYPSQAPLLTEDQTIDAVRGHAATLAGSEPYTDRVLASLPDLRVIARHGVGYDAIDVPAATRRGIAVTITPEGNHGAVAEHTFALMLAVTRSVASSAVECQQGLWMRRGMHIPLRGSVLGIVGLGRIGRAVARRALAFGMRVLACESRPDADFLAQHAVEIVDLEQLLAAADIVTLHAPLTPETKELINGRTLALMKRGSVLVNTSRGGLIQEDDLVEALRSKHLAGAALDVMACEPPPANHPLLSLAVVTPHTAAMDSQAVVDMSVAAAQSIVELLAGRLPTNGCVVNPDAEAAWRRRGPAC